MIPSGQLLVEIARAGSPWRRRSSSHRHPPSGRVKDFHLRAFEHARHTTNPLAREGARHRRCLSGRRPAVGGDHRGIPIPSIEGGNLQLGRGASMTSDSSLRPATYRPRSGSSTDTAAVANLSREEPDAGSLHAPVTSVCIRATRNHAMKWTFYARKSNRQSALPLSRPAVNTMLRPSGDHAGCTLSPSGCLMRWTFAPSASISRI
jgi:hypothetical protein